MKLKVGDRVMTEKWFVRCHPRRVSRVGTVMKIGPRGWPCCVAVLWDGCKRRQIISSTLLRKVRKP